MIINLLTDNSYFRQMRGEELQRLSVQQLQELEKTLESGLGSVLKTKVYLIQIMSASDCTVRVHTPLTVSFPVKIVEPKNPR